jgi:hypothetical protein
LIAFSPRALAIMRTPTQPFTAPQRNSANGAIWERYRAGYVGWRRNLTRDPDALPDLS